MCEYRIKPLKTRKEALCPDAASGRPGRVKNLFRISAYLLLISIFISGCAPNMAIKPGYDFSGIKRIAVLNFDGEKGSAAADIFILELMKKGFDVIERSRIESIIKEQDLGASGLIEPSTAKSIGKIFGVDAIITGSIIQYLPAQKRTVFFPVGDTVVITPGLYLVERGNNYVIYMTDAEIGISARMIDVETGSVVWVASDSIRGFSTDSAFQGVIISLAESVKSVFPKKSK
jgi:hypothetical protein